ncbi:FK506-binding protein 6 [Eurytemora carolleeae]|uniref:FK506-binding protein 6 n=1 Tax=Eurytemora carolleeae TaxID=1294199 RepID=UPI000C7766CE|nr:FK506-binding protein 6 [Eurytemora carolleeae]|eukprot:XP_023321354.1 FK506-binding protein 6-like [Eurytemora affinis]
MLLIPKQSDKQCIPSNQLSSIGFLGFIVSVINAAMSIANNLNSNNNNRNNNNNDNNDNNDNINIANLNSGQMNMNMVMAGRKRRSLYSSLLRLKRGVSGFCSSEPTPEQIVSMVGVVFIKTWFNLVLNPEINETCVLHHICQGNQQSIQTIDDKEGKRLALHLATVLTSVLSLNLELEPNLVIQAGRAGFDNENCEFKYSCN